MKKLGDVVKSTNSHIEKMICDDRFLKVLVIAVVVTMFVRAFFGIDVQDETYSLASIMHCVQGNVPLMQIWDGHTGFFLFAPVIAFYKAIVPSLDGVMLFFRLVCVTLAMVYLFVNARLLSDFYEDKRAFYIIFAILSLSPIYVLNYNNSICCLIGTACVIIYTTKNGESHMLRYFIAGVLMGLACLWGPNQVVTVIFFTGYVIWKNRKEFCFKRTGMFIAGIGIIGISFLIWILLNGNTEILLKGIDAILHGPHAQERGDFNLGFLYFTCVLMARPFFVREYFFFILMYIWAMFIINKLVDGTKRINYLWLSYCVFALLSVLPNRKDMGFGITGLFIGFAVLMIFVNKSFVKKNHIFYYAIGAFLVLYVISSANSNIMIAIECCNQLLSMAMAVGICESIIITPQTHSEPGNDDNPSENLMIQDDDNDEKQYILAGGRFDILTLRRVIICMAAIAVMINFGGFYGDGANVFALNKRVKAGIYKGMYTGQDKVDYIEDVEAFVDTCVNSIPDIENKKLGVLELNPMVYLSSNAKIYTPWTFDSTFAYFKYKSAKPVVDYYETFDGYPDIFVAIDSINQEFYDNDEYEINKILKDKYELKDSAVVGNPDNNIEARVWVLKDK